jgi:hypothetical protein
MSTSIDRSAERLHDLLDHYKRARGWLAESGYYEEIVRQQASSTSRITESEFLREYAWVILNSGFREAVIRKHFDYISLCFCDWESAAEIWRNRVGCIASASAASGNYRKLQAIIETARVLNEAGFVALKSQISDDPVGALSGLPYLGKVTTFHLAKNLGADVAKPDRHLMRVASRFGYADVNRMCSEIAIELGDRISVADLVLWRFEEANTNHGRQAAATKHQSGS